jgi:hypothetical protein
MKANGNAVVSQVAEIVGHCVLKAETCLTKHAPDVVDSAASVSISIASEVSASEADSTPATTQVM